jgi:carbon-monoxide dehydrogenase medium subunit|nr:FAD binding domain-containing protein [Candidatus Krumholzibacteria bacterium]
MWDVKEYLIATNPAEAVEMMAAGAGKGRYLAGGTDLLLEKPACDFVVDISRAQMSEVAVSPEGDLFVGAAASLEYLANDQAVRDFAGGAISRMAAWCCNRPVRTTATVGGNLCHAMPSADMAPVFMALDATCFVMGQDEQESLLLTDFFVGPRQTVLEGRLLVGLALPAEAAHWHCAGHKLTRSAEDISLVQVAASLGVQDGVVENVRIVLGAVAPVPMRSQLAENMVAGLKIAEVTPDILDDAALIAAGEAAPISDHRASAEYRRDMVRVLTRRMLDEVLDRARKGDQS